MENSGLVWVICRQKSHNRVFWTPPSRLELLVDDLEASVQNTIIPPPPKLEILMEDFETLAQNPSSTQDWNF